MCFADSAVPPAPAVNTGIAAATTLVLTAADGNRLGAYCARAAGPSGSGVVILPDVRGLHDFYKHLAKRFAEAGVDAVAIDYFGRTAGIPGDRSDAFEYAPHVKLTSREGVAADVAAAAAHLRDDAGGAVTSVFTMGFCFGGAMSWAQAAQGHGLAGSIGFYGVPARIEDLVPRMEAPLLLLVAGADFTPLAAFEEFDRTLTAAGKPHTMVVYPGAPHSFFDRAFTQWKDACTDAWAQMLRFIEINAGPGRGAAAGSP